MLRKTTLAGTLLLLLAAGGPSWADERPPTADEVKELVSRAAAAPQELIDLLVRMGTRVTVEDLTGPGRNTPLTAAVAVLPPDHPALTQDLRWLAPPTPATFLEALAPTEVQAGRRVPKHDYVSLVHPEYVEQVAMERRDGGVSGILAFRAPEVYDGALAFDLVHDVSGWRVRELRLPTSKLRTTWEDGRWRLYLPERAPTPPPSARERLDLPTVGTVGERPDARTRVVVRVTHAGWIRVEGVEEPLSLEELQRHLTGRAKGPTLREPDGASRLTAVLDVDATIPWTVSQWLMQTCAHPAVKIHRIAFGARTPAGEEGCIVTHLPRGGLPFDPGSESFVKHKLKVFKREDPAGASDLRALYARILRRHEAKGRPVDAVFEIVAPPPKGGLVPHGYVLQMVDVCLALGARHLVYEGAAMPRGGHDDVYTRAEALKRHIDSLRATAGVPQVRYGNDGEFVAADGADLPPVPARGLVAGPWGTRMDLGVVLLGEEVFDEPDNGRIAPGGGAGGAFHGRGGTARLEAAESGPAFAAAAARGVDEGLRWLAAHQAPNGGWPAQGFAEFCDGKPVSQASGKADGAGKAIYDVGVTGLALQAFLANGYTNRGRHPFAKVVSRGLRYLKNVQDPEGCFGPRSSQQYVYNHAMAALAMVEAYGMTSSPIFKGSAQRALDFVALARNPYFAWRYGIKPGDNDTSITGWMGLVLASAERINAAALAADRQPPLTVDAAWRDGVRAWLRKMTDPETGRVGYVQRGTGPARPQDVLQAFPADESEAMTASACVLRLFLGEDPSKTPDLQRGLDLILSKPPLWSGGRLDMYSWHWGTLAMFQVGGAHWEVWRRGLAEAVVATQRKDGDFCLARGSWDPRGPWAAHGGRVYSTAILVLTLSAQYRYDKVR